MWSMLFISLLVLDIKAGHGATFDIQGIVRHFQQQLSQHAHKIQAPNPVDPEVYMDSVRLSNSSNMCQSF
jgi:hypothetical protein